MIFHLFRLATLGKAALALSLVAGAYAFWAKYRSLLLPPAAKTDKPATSPKPATTSPKPTDPAVKECLAKYETLKTLKTTSAEAFEAALRTFNETCRSLLVPSSTK